MRVPAPSGVRAHGREIAFVLKVLPMLPSGIVDRLTRPPLIERVHYRAEGREVSADLYRPPGPGPHPALVICLGVVPFGVDHPQVPRLSEALARAGFVALIHWSDAMRDRRLVPEDAENIARAYDYLLSRPDVDAGRSGLFGTCVGGSFAFLAAADPLIRDRVTFVGAFAPFSSLWTFARDIASASRDDGGGVRPWRVDPLTREVFERTVRDFPVGENAGALLRARDRDEADTVLRSLSTDAKARLDAMSPILHLSDIHAERVVFGHDRDDNVIPVGESRRLASALANRKGTAFTEYAMFEHADPTKRHLSPIAMARQVGRFYGSLYPIFSRST